MKGHWVLVMAMAAELSAHAGECVALYAQSDLFMPNGMLPRAEARTASIFREIGVELRWQSEPVFSRSAKQGCGAPIMIRLDATARKRVSPDALAYAMPYAQSGTCIHVLLDRLLEDRNERFDTTKLAYVLAHEIGHVLEKVDGHSQDGIMKAHWGVQDFRRMERGSLRFAEEDVGLIRRGQL